MFVVLTRLKKMVNLSVNRVRVKVVKNKVAPPFRQTQFHIMYGVAISKEGCVLDMGVEAGFVKKSGSWFNYGDERLGQGREKRPERTLKEHPDIRNEIENKVRAEYDLPAIGEEPVAADLSQIPSRLKSDGFH